ncbi:MULTISPECIES: PQQ-dependent sugar dehydrogenase [Salinibaculum]|uniref:PQQ-dependent sugar dehydrogenase n=1 Tax=Salinibaculum TaxID=2732368 RepID=UPI0030CA8D6C
MQRGPAGPLSRRAFLAVTGTAALAGCGGDAPPRTPPGTVRDDYEHPTPGGSPSWDAPTGSPRAELSVEVLVENLEIPWDLAFSGTGELFMTQRTGSVVRFDAGEVSEVAKPQDAIDAGSIPPGSDQSSWWVEGGEGGTLGVAVHPSYPDEPWVYVYYTASAGGGKRNRVVRYDVSADDPGATEEVLLGGIPANKYHNGGRIRFGPDDNLWVCTGDAGTPEDARDPESLAGKVLRLAPDGRAPASNPDLGGDPRVFTYGHRNPQGIDWLPGGVPIVSEHGPSGQDEVNLLVPGGDYGWNDVRAAPGSDGEYDAYPANDDVVPPLLNTGAGASWAPTGATFYTGTDCPAWRHRFVVGGLVSQAVWVVTLTPPGGELPPLDGYARRFDADWFHPAFTATAHQLLQNDLGRVRHVAQSPSGELYAITSNRDGRATGPFPRERDDVLVRLRSA